MIDDIFGIPIYESEVLAKNEIIFVDPNHPEKGYIVRNLEEFQKKLEEK